MGAFCNKMTDCFGGSTKNHSSHHPPNTNYHRLDQSQNGVAINNKGKKNISPVVYSQNQQHSSQNKNGSNSSNKINVQSDVVQYKVQQNENDYEDENNDNDDQNDSQKRAMKKIDSTKYLLKHSNLSAILEEDEQHKDSLKLVRRKHSKDAKKNPYGEDSLQNSILNLHNVDESSDQSPVQKEENGFAHIHKLPIGESIGKFLPDYKKLTEEAMENFCNIINRDFQVDGYTLEHNQTESESSGLYSQIYIKPVDDGKYKYFKIRTEYNLYNCSARDYLLFTTDVEKSKQNNPSIDEYIHVSSHNDYHIMYIIYKKVLMCSPRDFIYLKYNKQIDSNTYISVQFSIEIPSYPHKQGVERGIITLSGSLISEEVDNYGKKFIRLSNYAESNLKLSLAHKLMKPSTTKEVKKFILNMQDLFLKEGNQ